MKLHLVMGEISCAQAGKHQWASMNETGHPRACDQISRGSEVWGAVLSPKGMQNYQSKKKTNPVCLCFRPRDKTDQLEGRGQHKACGYHFQTARAKADINSRSCNSQEHPSSSSFWKHWHWSRTFSSLKQRIEPMKAAQDGMGWEETMRRMCVPLTTPGAAEQAETPTEDHFRLRNPLSTAALPHPCVTILISSQNLWLSQVHWLQENSQLTNPEKTPVSSPGTHQTAGSDVPCPSSSFPSSPLVWLNWRGE